jgi:hypothetical protein
MLQLVREINRWILEFICAFAGSGDSVAHGVLGATQQDPFTGW